MVATLLSRLKLPPRPMPSRPPSGFPPHAADGPNSSDEKTEKNYRRQAITDVDMYSSYGLAQKAVSSSKSSCNELPIMQEHSSACWT